METAVENWLPYSLSARWAPGLSKKVELQSFKQPKGTPMTDDGLALCELAAKSGDGHQTWRNDYRDRSLVGLQAHFRKDRFLGRPTMRVIQTLRWFRDERSNLESLSPFSGGDVLGWGLRQQPARHRLPR